MESDVAAATERSPANRIVDWNEIHRTKAWGTWPSEAFVRFMARHYDASVLAGGAPDGGKQFLDVGCGAGAQLRYFVNGAASENGHTVVAIDASATAMSRAQKFAYAARGRIMLKVADVREYEPSEKFDCIIDVCTLQHLDQAAAYRTVTKFMKWLKPGGRVFSKMLNNVVKIDALDARLIGASGIARLFHGWQLDLQREDRHIPGDKHEGDAMISHWIIDASPG